MATESAAEKTIANIASATQSIIEMGKFPIALGGEEVKTRKVYAVKHLDADVLVPKNIQKIDTPDDFPEKIFFTLDVDGMDPSIFPSTGTPVPSGIGWYQILSIFNSVLDQRDIIGFDIMEFAPIKDFHTYQFLPHFWPINLWEWFHDHEIERC